MNSLQLIMEEMKIANLKQEEERKLDRLMLTESRNMLRIMGIEIKTVKIIIIILLIKIMNFWKE